MSCVCAELSDQGTGTWDEKKRTIRIILQGGKKMEVLTGKINRDELRSLDSGYFDDMIKAVVDIEKEIIAIDAELHADLEGLLLDEGSRQADLWG